MPLPTSLHLTYKTVWQITNETVKKEALELWRSYNALPEGQEEDRLKCLCVVAYNNGTDLVGVSTILLKYFNVVKANIALFRCLVKEEYRRSGVATELAVRCKVVMEEWSKTHPAEKLAGFGTIPESPN